MKNQLLQETAAGLAAYKVGEDEPSDTIVLN